MKKPKNKHGTCCITITHRVPVKAVFKGWSDYVDDKGNPYPLFEYILIKSKVKRITKEDIMEFYGNQSELDDTFEEEAE